MNEDEQVIWGQPVSFLDFVLGFLVTPNQRRVELVPKTDPLKFYTREKVAPPSQDLGEIRDANKERVNKSLSNYASNNFLLSTSNIRPDLNGRYNPGLGLFAGDLTALALSMGFDPFNASNYYKVATLIPKFRNWGLTRLLANELNNEVRVAGELGKNVGKSTVNPIIRTKIGDVEINNPELYYHLSGLGKAKNFFNTNRMRTPQEEYWLKLEHVPLELRTGIIPGFPQNPGRAMFSLGKLWYGLNPEQFPDLLVTAKEMPVANSKAGIIRGSLLKLESQGTRRVTSDNIGDIGPHTNQNTSAYTYIPGYGYRQIQLEPKTSLKFFERPLSRISEAERLGISKGERNSYINSPLRYDEEGNLYTNKNYFYRKGWGIIDDALKTGIIRVPEGDYKVEVLKKYPFLNDNNPFSTQKMSHKFPYFSEGKLNPDKYGHAPDVIVIPSKGVDWAGASKFSTLIEGKIPAETGGRGTPLINGELNKFPTSRALLFRINSKTGRYEPIIGKNKPIINPDENWIKWESDYWAPLKKFILK